MKGCMWPADSIPCGIEERRRRWRRRHASTGGFKEAMKVANWRLEAKDSNVKRASVVEGSHLWRGGVCLGGNLGGVAKKASGEPCL